MRIFSLRSPVPTWLRRAASRAWVCFSSSISKSLERSIFIAIARFLSCDFSCWHFTTTPVGLCVRRTALSVVLTLCPPAPVERITSIWMSAGLIWTSTSSASGITATVTVLVWMRPCASVAGTRWTRCTPDSYLRLE